MTRDWLTFAMVATLTLGWWAWLDAVSVGLWRLASWLVAAACCP